MLVQIVTENGQKKIIPLTADAGAGNPVGTIIPMYKKSSPNGYLYCDGSTFDQTKYPLLYAYLGSNVLPDLREVGLKGAEKNATYIFDSTETDPRTGQAGTQNHDVFTQGEFKDDQLQDHKHSIGDANSTMGTFLSNVLDGGSVWIPKMGVTGVVTKNTTDSRHGTVTRGKSFGVFYYIKATSGLSENAQDNVINTLNEQRSYSTEEHLTGRKWIDGKPIYRKVLTGNVTPSDNAEINISSLNVSYVVDVLGSVSTSNTIIPFGYSTTNLERVTGYYSTTNSTYVVQSSYAGTYYVILEYTKTTD